MGDAHRRHQIVWRLFYAVCNKWICRKFHFTHEDLHIDGPVLLIPNHVSAWDPFLVAMSLKDKQVYYVASEHLFRKGIATKMLTWLVAPIPRSKASAGTDTVRACLRHLRSGHSVCIFSEGEQSWDGRNHPVFAATGKLAKTSGATLVTYRLEGIYLSKPRWADTVRRGTSHGHPVGIYPPDILKTMSADEITARINQDIREDAWERQRTFPVSYRGRRLAEGLERVLYLCPQCRRIGTLTSKDDRLSCPCGLSVRYLRDGFFEPETPFADIAQWEDWQKESLRTGDYEHENVLFTDDSVQLTEIGAGHTETPLCEDTLIQYPDHLKCGTYDFSLSEIDNMAMTRTHILLFSIAGSYFQLRARPGINFRKYLELWKAQE
ncbi:MAG: 1-acyl-sn-glycerol-3-phosphate acyltransferase [Clostridiales bacterium]|nr:1-acyl-sn-glycerol-3-phosphate acyltransferase [Clostridiales bacterium]